MKNKYTIVMAMAMLLGACKEKPVAPAPARAATEEVNKIQSGIYMGPNKGSCLCVNAEKALAADSGTLVVMAIDLGQGIAQASDDMKANLKGTFERLRFVSKEQITDAESGTKFTRVQKANDCELLNTTAAEPLGYQDFCIEGKAHGRQKNL